MAGSAISAATPGAPSDAARRVGTWLGLAVAALAIVVGGPVLALLSDADVGAAALGLAIPTLLTGMLAGRAFGRRAWRARTLRARVVTSLLMALVATAVGDYLVGVGIALNAAGTDHNPGLIFAAPIIGLTLWPVGIVLFGAVAYPVTFVASLVWSWLMARHVPA